MIRQLAFAVALMLPGVATAAAAAEGMTLHVEATGEVPPDMAIFDRDLTGKGSDPAKAKAAVEAQLGDLAGKLRVAGVGSGDISFQLGEVTPDVEAAPPALAAPLPFGPGGAGKGGANPAAREPAYACTATVQVTLRDLRKLPQIQPILMAAGGGFFNPRMARYLHADQGGAHRRAVELAFANAAREAEIYAATMHRKLGVVIRVSNAKPPTNVMDVFQRIAQLDVPGSAARSSPFVEQAGVAIDYELLP